MQQAPPLDQYELAALAIVENSDIDTFNSMFDSPAFVSALHRLRVRGLVRKTATRWVKVKKGKSS